MNDPLYVIELKFSNGGIEFQGDRQWTKRNVVENVAVGEWGRGVRVLKVLEIREDENRAEDITAEIASAVASKFYEDREPVSYAIQNFLHDHLGVTSTRGLNLSEAA